MHQIGWKADYSKSDYVSILGHGCRVSQFSQFYDRVFNQILPRPYVGCYQVEKGNLFFKEKCIVGLAKSVGIFVMVSISDMPTLKYWRNLENYDS